MASLHTRTTYNYVSHVCSFTCADPGKLQHLGLFHKVFFAHFTFCRLFYADSWTCESFLQFLSLPFFCASFFVSRPRLRLILTSRACFLSDSSLGSCGRESGHRLVPVLYVPHKQESPQSSRCDASVPTALPPS